MLVNKHVKKASLQVQPHAGLMMGQLRRLWANIKQTLTYGLTQLTIIAKNHID